MTPSSDGVFFIRFVSSSFSLNVFDLCKKLLQYFAQYNIFLRLFFYLNGMILKFHPSFDFQNNFKPCQFLKIGLNRNESIAFFYT